MTINITAIGSSGCVGFEGIEAERTSEHLTLRVLGRRPAGNAVCPALAPIFAQQYTDAGLSARVNPFEVVINGTRYLVTVEP